MAVAIRPTTRPPAGPHQHRAVDTIMDREAVLVEYGTGTGKTRVIAEACEALVAAGDIPILVLVPNQLVEQTMEEFVRWTSTAWVDKHVMPLWGMDIGTRRQHLKFGKKNVYLLSHESLSYDLIREGLASRWWSAVFLDEASRFRNYSKRTKTLQTLGRRADTRYAFTGNLAPKNPADVWYVMNWLAPRMFGVSQRKLFIFEYCLLGGWQGNQPMGIRPDRLAKFRALMDAQRITCQLSDLRDMPDRVLHTYRTNLPRDAELAYEQMQEELRVEIERVDDETFHSMVRTYATRLQRLQEIGAGFARNIEGDVAPLGCAKTTELIEILKDDPTAPTVIWYWWRPEYDNIKKALTKARIPFVWLGEKDAVPRFMNGKVEVFVSQIAKGGYGLNLTRATRMIYHSLPWDLDAYLQSQERNMRLTTTAKRLEIIHLVNRDTVDEYVRTKLIQKADMSSQLTKSQALDILTLRK